MLLLIIEIFLLMVFAALIGLMLGWLLWRYRRMPIERDRWVDRLIENQRLERELRDRPTRDEVLAIRESNERLRSAGNVDPEPYVRAIDERDRVIDRLRDQVADANAALHAAQETAQAAVERAEAVSTEAEARSAELGGAGDGAEPELDEIDTGPTIDPAEIESLRGDLSKAREIADQLNERYLRTRQAEDDLRARVIELERAHAKEAQARQAHAKRISELRETLTKVHNIVGADLEMMSERALGPGEPRPDAAGRSLPSGERERDPDREITIVADDEAPFDAERTIDLDEWHRNGNETEPARSHEGRPGA
ncbi:MAG: hypothetical protein S0880_02035 [Actinomycetota bacterium]|nr:hypothetical protein [Actinomycetota bacterium]